MGEEREILHRDANPEAGYGYSPFSIGPSLSESQCWGCLLLLGYNKHFLQETFSPALRVQVFISFEGQMNDSSLVWIHRACGNRLMDAFGFIAHFHCQLYDGLFSPLSVVFRIYDDGGPFPQILVDHLAHKELNGIKCLALSSNEEAGFVTLYIEGNFSIRAFRGHPRIDGYEGQNIL